jgi:hypothetical protein
MAPAELDAEAGRATDGSPSFCPFEPPERTPARFKGLGSRIGADHRNERGVLAGPPGALRRLGIGERCSDQEAAAKRAYRHFSIIAAVGRLRDDGDELGGGGSCTRVARASQ